jgi:hypothetical protein
MPADRSTAFATMARHLNKLKRALSERGITAVEQSSGRSYIALRVAGLPGAITCRTNPADAHHWWYWLDNKPFTPAADAEQATVAATKLQKLLAEAPR